MVTNQLKWQRQLLWEHQRICRYYRLALPTPLLVISEAAGRAGAWCATPTPGVLQIAAWLIREHGWEVVLEVLKHEMSHQYVAHTIGSGAEPPHGPAFQEACRRLGVHPLFRRAQSTIPHRLSPADGRDEGCSPILAKVEKLLALAGSANEHEATRAMEKAGELMRRHNLQRPGPPPLASDGDDTISDAATTCDYLVINSGRRRQAAHHPHLAALLQDFFYVKTISYSLYQPRPGIMQRVLELLGRRENLAVAEYVYHFLEAQLPRLWQQHRHRHRPPGRARNSYYIGVLTGFRDKLRRQEQHADGDGRDTDGHQGDQGVQNHQALTCSRRLCARDPELNRFLRQRYPHLRRGGGRGRRLHAASFQAGQADGERLVLHQGLKQSQGNRGKLLE